MRRRAGSAAAAGQARGGGHVLGAARRDRQDAQCRHCSRAHPGRGGSDRAARQARLFRGVRLPRQGGRRPDDDRHDLQHRLHDQADDGGRRAPALRAGPAADGRPGREIFPEIRRHEGRGAGRQRREHRRHGAGRPQDHHPGPLPPHLRVDLWRARQHGGAQALSSRQRPGRRGAERRGIPRQARRATSAAPARRGVGLRLRSRRARARGRATQRANARRLPARQRAQAARHGRHLLPHSGRQGCSATPRRCRTIPTPASRNR